MRIYALGVVFAASLLSTSMAADRQFNIRNSCSFSIWPAMSSFSTGTSAIYTGTRGWKAEPGSDKAISM